MHHRGGRGGAGPEPAGRRRRLPWPVVVPAMLVAAGWGCQQMPPWFYEDTSGGGATVADLGFDSWRKDTLHCAERLCEYRYVVEVDEPGTLRAEVYAPLDPGGPEFSLALLDEQGEEVARPVDDDARPRRLAYEASPGRYVLRVAGRGENEGPLRYDVVVFHADRARPEVRRRPRPAVEPKPAPPRPREQPSPERADEPRPDPSSDAAPEVLATAEVLDLEEEPGGGTFVLLDKGEPHGVRKEMRGALRTGGRGGEGEGRTIGEFVIVEVYRDGSRARIEGELEGRVGIDTVAEIHR